MSLVDIDDELVDGIRERSEAAFTAVYRLLASDLLSFADGMLHDRDAAEDAVQQSFLELARAAPTVPADGRACRAWLYRTVRFSALDEIRRRRRHPEHPTDRLPEESTVQDPTMPDPELRAALLELTDRQRTIVVLRHVIGAPVDDIARILGSNRAAVYAASARAERHLRRSLRGVESRADPASPPWKRDRP